MAVTAMFRRNWCRQVETSERALEANHQLHTSLTRLRERDEDLRATQEVARLGIYSLEYGEDVFTGSEELRDILGFEPDEPLTVRLWRKVIHPEDRDRAERIAARTPGLTQLNIQYRVIRPIDGRTVSL